MYAKIGRMTTAIFGTITTYKLMSHAPSFSASASQTALMPTCKTIAEGIGRLRAALQQKPSALPPDVRSRLMQCVCSIGHNQCERGTQHCRRPLFRLFRLLACLTPTAR